MKLSIIIPMYNIGNYIGQCLDSLINQDLEIINYEIIIINDGSIDNGLQIAMKYQSNHSNIKIITQNNQGLSAARNAGIEDAQGKYLWFVDGDDWILPNCLKYIISICDRNNLDIYSFNRIDVYPDHEIKINNTYPCSGKVITGVEYMRVNMYGSPVCTCIYKTKYLREQTLLFINRIIHEDSEFNTRAFFFAKRFMVESIYFYYYRRERVGSIITSLSIKSPIDMLKVQETIFSLIANCSNNRQDKIILGNYAAVSLNVSLTILFNIDNSGEMKTYIFALLRIKNMVSKNLALSSNVWSKIESLLIKIHPLILVWFYFKIVKNQIFRKLFDLWKTNLFYKPQVESITQI